MSDRVSSSFILWGGVLLVLALWALSVLAVRYDTRRRGLRELESKAWLALAAAVPLLGFAIYLALRIYDRYIAQPAHPSSEGDDARLTAVKARVPDHPPVQPGSGDVPEPAWGKALRGRSNGGHAQPFESIPSTAVAVAQKPLRTGYALVVLKGPHLGQQFILNKLPVRIGRGPDVSVPLDADLNVSRNHAEIYEWNGRLRIRDLQSSHGTWINDAPAADQAITPGDQITVGKTVLIVREIE